MYFIVFFGGLLIIFSFCILLVVLFLFVAELDSGFWICRRSLSWGI